MPLQEYFWSDESHGREEDLKFISQSVRKELFVKAKFVRDCKLKLLVGLKLNADQSSEFPENMLSPCGKRPQERSQTW
jgi:hypothetical protein